MDPAESADDSRFDLGVQVDGAGTLRALSEATPAPAWRARAALDPLAALIDGGTEDGVG